MNPLTLKVLSRLMVYPSAELLPALEEMRSIVKAESSLDAGIRERLLDFIDQFDERELGAVQEEYVSLFDRGRALSLHLFEHVHGESRDRGQAMVDLINLYQENGLELDARELPDYLPLVLEYLSERPPEDTFELLGDAMPIIVLLGARLRERDSSYASLFESLEALVGSPDNAEDLREAASQEGPDQTIVNMDEIWEEEQVRFMGNSEPTSDCGAASAPLKRNLNQQQRTSRARS
ncbi:nitrate reductase molybdenum cofactor assembly chaperone [Wenzhouxiangella limi]|uniref:Nitrate reductase molybdenum cofactor assembly chaperone n=1 Tax=Wenzhouxiangella limi TaxID=2707351 RepID=A0A845V0X2_9GAMM|nr:nitrate reductase molybdenum cofactor assembly chaperone [Wenzhouxiangella limi]NDY96232.1 nitrate reductase molybdenum cofactor assembly chaperone [Wenzhouxiangella limi]